MPRPRNINHFPLVTLLFPIYVDRSRHRFCKGGSRFGCVWNCKDRSRPARTLREDNVYVMCFVGAGRAPPMLFKRRDFIYDINLSVSRECCEHIARSWKWPAVDRDDSVPQRSKVSEAFLVDLRGMGG